MGQQLSKFSCLNFTIAGSVPEDPQSQDEATVDLRIFVQSRDPEVLSASSIVDSDRASFARYCIENLLQGYPGSTMAPNMRQAIGRPFFEYWVSLVPQSFVKETAHHPDGIVVEIPSPTLTKDYPPRYQPSYETKSPVDLSSFDPTNRASIGYICMGRYVSTWGSLYFLFGIVPSSHFPPPKLLLLSELTSPPLQRSGNKSSNANLGLL
jgi:hypothetical protein